MLFDFCMGGRVEGVAEQDIVRLKRIEHAAQQGLLIAALAFTGACGRIEQRATTQADQCHHAADRKAQAGFLPARLRIDLRLRAQADNARACLMQTEFHPLAVPTEHHLGPPRTAAAVFCFIDADQAARAECCRACSRAVIMGLPGRPSSAPRAISGKTE